MSAFVKESMRPTAAKGKGHGHKLSAMLAEAWSEQHRLQQFDDCAALESEKEPLFVESECYKLGFCHCGQGTNGSIGKQTVFFHKKLVTLLKPYLFTKTKRTPKSERIAGDPEAKKKKKEYTKARKAVMKGFLVMELVPLPTEGKGPSCSSELLETLCDGAVEAPEDLVAPRFHEWLALASQKVSSSTLPRVVQEPLPGKSVWLHIGYCNYKTMHFTGLPMMCQSVQNHASDDAAKMEADLCVPDPVEPVSSFDFLMKHVSFELKYQARFWALQATSAVLTAAKMVPNRMVARPFPGIPPLVVWQGKSLELWERDELSKKKKQKKAGEKKRKQPVAATRRALQFPEPEGKSKRLRLSHTGADSAAEAPMIQVLDDTHELEFDEAGVPKDGDADNSSSSSSSSSDSLDTSSSSSQTPDQDVDDNGLFLEFATPGTGGAWQEEGAEEEEPETDPCVDPDKVMPASAVESKPGDVEAAPVDAAEPSSSRVRGPGPADSRQSADVLSVPGCGELRYHSTTRNVVAFCAAHRDRDCRRSRTVVPNARRAGQGRPIGLLVAWLQDPDSHEGPNSRTFVHPFDKRQEARNFFDRLPDSGLFGQCERPREAGEGPEPERIP